MDRIRTSSCEANIVSHCNLRCRYCDQWAPFWEEEFMPLTVLERDLTRLAEALVVSEFKILGGEPLLSNQLLDVISIIRASGIAENVTIVTNGLLLDRLPAEVWKAIDRMWISLYPGVKYRMSVDEAEAIAAQYGVKLYIQDHIQYPFRLTSLNQRIEDDRLIRIAHRYCVDRHTCNTIHHGRFFACTPATVFGARMQRLGIEESQPITDYVSIHECDDLRAALEEYLRRENPLHSCSYCLGSLGRPVPADQGNRVMLEDRLREDHRDPWSLLNPDLIGKLKQRLDADGLDSEIPV
jgi:organic radical activating enzyme